MVKRVGRSGRVGEIVLRLGWAGLFVILLAAPGSALAGSADAPDAALLERPPSWRLPSPPLPDSAAGERGPFFYRGLDYGSEALIHPVQLVVNGGFGILQFGDRDTRLARVQYKRGWNRVWSDLRHPVRAIEEAGWGEFVRTELIPVSASRKSARYWPNYTLHLVGGGMSYALMAEWFEHHRFARPHAWAGGTITAYHLLNEVVENQDQPGPTTDAVADLMLFDPAGVLLFSWPGVSGFFGRTLNLRDWSNQPGYEFAHGSIENQGQNFSIKWRPRWSERWGLFYYFGNHGEGGLTYTLPNGSAYSLGAGLAANKLIDLGRGERTAELLPSAGFFYDRNGSLLFSVMTSRSNRNRVRVNVYPGLVRIAGHTAGAFAVWNDHGVPLAGLQVTWSPLGVAFKR